MAIRYVYVFFSPSLNEYYFGESDDVMTKLNRLNSDYFDSLKNHKKATDWEIKLIITCENKSQAVGILKYLSTKYSVEYLNKLSIHPELVKRLLNKFSQKNMNQDTSFFDPID